jgi:CNT family concentrative nucleoside transporter
MPWLNLLSLFGLVALCVIAWLGSENRRVVPWRVVLWGIGLQLVLGALVFWVPVSRSAVLVINDGVNAALDLTEAGSRFVFGPLLVPDTTVTPGPILAGRWIARAITPPYVPVPGDRLSPDHINLGYVFAFRALPSVIFFSALMSLLYSLRLIQPLVNLFARIFRRTMRLSGAEALSGSANIFVGIEATLVVRPYLAEMTRSELFAILASCFGSIASTVLALYAGLLRPVFPNITGHLVSASIMAIPACFVMSKLLVPETEVPKTLGKVVEETTITSSEEAGTQDSEPALISPVESLIVGAMDGVKLAVGIAALLIAILGLVAIVNHLIPLRTIVGILFVPLTFLTGVSLNWQEIWQSSLILGQRLIETEVPAYLQLAILSGKGMLSDRALLVISYALCGFAHLPSVGIFVGGLIALVPSRRKDIVELGWKSLWAATLATLMIGAIAGLFDTGNPTILGR